MWRTIEIVPSSIRGDPQVIAACEAIDKELAQIYECIPSILFWPFVEQQVPPLLDVLSWEMHVDIWQNIEGAPLTVEKKQELISQSIDWHRHKGTRWVVDQMLKTVFNQGTVTEWPEYGGRPYFFRIVTEDEIVDPAKMLKVIEAIYAVKNVRSWLDTPGFIRSRRQQQTLWHGIAVTQHITTKVKLARTTRTL